MCQSTTLLSASYTSSTPLSHPHNISSPTPPTSPASSSSTASTTSSPPSPRTMPSSIPESRSRRYHLRPSSSAGPSELRKSRRLFSRHASSLLSPSVTIPSEDLDSRRRSFLAKPPAPGAARRVLAVLNQSQRRASAFSSRKPPANTSRVSGTGYEDDHQSPLDPQHFHNISSHHINIPLVPLTILQPNARSTPRVDNPDPVRLDSGTSSLPSSRGGTLLDVEASEVSDDVNSNAGSKSRGLVRVSIPCSSIMSDHTDTSAIAFKCVGEEEAEVPEAPLEYSKKMGIGQAWAVFDDKIRKLQAEIDVLKDEKTEIHRANTDLKIRNNELEALLQSFSLRSTHTTAEVDSLTRQLKDNRGAHARRIKELESQLEKEKLTYSDDLDKQRSIQRRLKAEIDMLRDSKVGFTKGRSSPALPTRKERAVPLPRTSSKRDVNGRPLLVDELVTRAQKVNFSRTKSAGSVHDRPRRRSERSDRLSSSARQTVAQKKLLPASVSSDGGTSCSSRTRARRSLIRRAFIAHIHSNKYRSTKSAWVEFLGGENGHVSPDQFARAVRGLAVASNARDRDLGLLREEVCGAELCDTGVVTWGMFARFCQETRGEPT